MSTHVFFSSMGMVLGTVLLVFAMISWALVQRGRASRAQADAYQRLSERAVAAEAATAAALATLRDDFADMRARMAAVEAVLKDVG